MPKLTDGEGQISKRKEKDDDDERDDKLGKR